MNNGTLITAKPSEGRFEFTGSAVPLRDNTNYGKEWLCPQTRCEDDREREIVVDDKTLLSYPPIYRGIVLLSEMVAKLPLNLHCGDEESECKIAKDHPAHWLMRYQPNDIINAYDFKKALQYHKCLGNSYAHIGRTVGGQLSDLVLLDRNHTRPFWGRTEQGGPLDLYYETNVCGTEFIFHHSEILHFKGLSFDGIIGHELKDIFKNEIGLGMAVCEQKLEFYKDGGVGGGVLYFKRNMSREKQLETMKYWKSVRSGRKAGTRVAMLNSDTTGFEGNEIASRSAESNETRKFQVGSAANIIGLPQHKLGGDQITAYASLEQENKALLNDGYDPHLCAIEEQLNQKLLTKQERMDGHYFSFDRSKIEQASLQELTEAADKAVNGGLSTLNEWNARHNLPPAKECGDRLRIPLNIGFCDSLDENEETESEPMSTERAIEDTVRNQITGAVNRLSKAANSASKDPEKFQTFLGTYTIKHANHVDEMVSTGNRLLESIGKNPITGLAERFKNELPEDPEQVKEFTAQVIETWPEEITKARMSDGN